MTPCSICDEKYRAAIRFDGPADSGSIEKDIDVSRICVEDVDGGMRLYFHE